MRISIEKCRRLPDWPWWAVAVVAGWLALVGLAAAMSQQAGTHIELCLFKKLTGLPCPTCGTTRGVLCFLDGRPVDGFLHNPLVFSLLAVLAIWLVMRITTGRKLTLNLTRLQKSVAWILLASAVAANWVYVIYFVG